MPVGFRCLGGGLKWSEFWVKTLNNITVGTCSRNWYAYEVSLAWREIGVKVSFIFPRRARGSRAARVAGQGRKLSRTLREWGIPCNFGFASANCSRKEESVFFKHLGCTLWCWKMKIKTEFQRIVLIKWMCWSKEDGRILICSLNDFRNETPEVVCRGFVCFRKDFFPPSLDYRWVSWDLLSNIRGIFRLSDFITTFFIIVPWGAINNTWLICEYGMFQGMCVF